MFGARLGYVGVDFGSGGKVAIGKQWGVHTDVTMYTTDQFNVFGSEASATYTGDTDGGLLGTGRADQAVSYHNNLFKILDLGAQVQFRTTENDDVVDGAGLSAQLTILPGTKIGASSTKSYFDDLTKTFVRGLGGDAEIAAVGARLDWKVLQAGLVYARQRNADLTNVLVAGLPGSELDVESIVFDADGVEVFARVNFPGFAVIGGFNYYKPDVNDPLINPDFRVRYAIAGAEVHLAETPLISTPKPACSTTASARMVRKGFNAPDRRDFITGSASRASTGSRDTNLAESGGRRRVWNEVSKRMQSHENRYEAMVHAGGPQPRAGCCSCVHFGLRRSRTDTPTGAERVGVR